MHKSQLLRQTSLLSVLLLEQAVVAKVEALRLTLQYSPVSNQTLVQTLLQSDQTACKSLLTVMESGWTSWSSVTCSKKSKQIQTRSRLSWGASLLTRLVFQRVSKESAETLAISQETSCLIQPLSQPWIRESAGMMETSRGTRTLSTQWALKWQATSHRSVRTWDTSTLTISKSL